LAHALAEVYNIKAKEIMGRRRVVAKEEMVEMGEELKHSTFEEMRDVLMLKDILKNNFQIKFFLMLKDTSSNAFVNSGPR